MGEWMGALPKGKRLWAEAEAMSSYVGKSFCNVDHRQKESASLVGVSIDVL